MTNKEMAEKLHKSILLAWDNYKKIDKDNNNATGLNTFLSAPALKDAYKKWQNAVREYYDFAASIENKSFKDTVS